MYNKIVYDFFKSNKDVKQWKQCNNGKDCCILDIPVNVRNSIRNYFDIGNQEELLFVRDTSFWNLGNQGLVLTDAGLYCIPDNNDANSKIGFSWGDVKEVRYKDGALFFYGYSEDEVCPIHMSYFIKSDKENMIVGYGKAIARALSGIAVLVNHEDPFETADNEVDQRLKANDSAGAISYLQQLIAADDGTYKSYWYYRLGQIYLSMDDREANFPKAKSFYEEGLKYCEEGSPISLWLHNGRRSAVSLDALEEINNNGNKMTAIADDRRESLLVSQNATDQTYSDGRLMKDDARADFEFMNKSYYELFCSQPYNDRKVLLVVDKYTDLYQNSISILTKSDSQAAGIVFPIGHPQSNQLYVGHPYIPTKYIPFEDYQLEFVEDKVREFCWLMQCMGATKISISANNDYGLDASISSRQKASGSSSYGFTSVNGSGNRNSGLTLVEQISKAINLNQTFNPTKGPYIPDNLVWYQTEASWQRLCNQRMQGAFLHAKETIESRKSCMLSGSELLTIKGEIKTLFEASGEWTQELEYKFQQQDNATLSFDVEFAPLDSLGLPDTNSLRHAISPKQKEDYVQHSVDFTTEEQEYLDMYREYAADGELSERDRKMLDKFRSRLGISEERARELEETCSKPQLTEDEQEYLEMYREYAEDGEISERDRKMLNKMRDRMGISEERAQEIEQNSR